jgi:hypothetical protein
MATIEQEVKSRIDQINPEKSEGRLAQAIEEQTAKLPSDLFLWVSLGAMAASLAFKAFRRDDQALFVGLWAPAFLLFGIYNKLVKQHGHDSGSRENEM